MADFINIVFGQPGQRDENFEAMKKMICDNHWITIRESHKTCGSGDCFKRAKFWVKTTLHGHRSEDVDDV